MPEFDQISLLKRFEPILKFSQGERFFPCNVAPYVAESSLWAKKPDKPPEQLLPEGELDLDRLGTLHLQGANQVHYLHFISPMNLGEMAEFRINELREAVRNREFHPTRSRLARVGYLARIADMAFSLLLLLRGRVPGDSMAAASIMFEKMLSEQRSFKYYGRVLHQGGWVILQYWYFYPFNNWRTGFYGANDHEADWEMVNIYCYQDQDGEKIHPAWVAYASHNLFGDDLRRHWDDPELEKDGEHPVVYVGGGSHASYYQAGEYLTQLTLPFLRPFRNALSFVDKGLKRLFREQDLSTGEAEDETQAFTIPFVDYALGDGLSIGPGCEDVWETPDVLNPAPDWVMNYRGLWGYYARDPFSGEDAPAGPRYNRDGSVRFAWFDPLDWAGMGKVAPPDQQVKVIQNRSKAVKTEIRNLTKEIDVMQDALYEQGIGLSAIQEVSHLRAEGESAKLTLEEKQAELVEKRRRLTVQESILEALERHGEESLNGEKILLRTHIQHAHRPQIKRNLRFSWLAEVWAAISIGLMTIGFVMLIVFARQFLLIGLLGMLLVMLTVEAAFRRNLASLVRWMSVFMAIFGFGILLFEFFWFFILMIVLVIGFYMIVENLRELFARRKG